MPEVIPSPADPIQLATVPPASSTEIGRILELAVRTKVDVNTIERLVDLHHRVADRDARMEFHRALADFKSACPAIPKTARRDVRPRTGAPYTTYYADLPQIAAIIDTLLAERGISYSWDSVTDGATMTMTCILRHVNGHSEKSSWTCPIDKTGSMNEPQQYASTSTYAKRQTLIQVTGIVTADVDDDAAGAAHAKISAADVREISDELHIIGADVAAFLKYMEIEKLADMPLSRLAEARAALAAKRRKEGAS